MRLRVNARAPLPEPLVIPPRPRLENQSRPEDASLLSPPSAWRGSQHDVPWIQQRTVVRSPEAEWTLVAGPSPLSSSRTMAAEMERRHSKWRLGKKIKRIASSIFPRGNSASAKSPTSAVSSHGPLPRHALRQVVSASQLRSSYQTPHRPRPPRLVTRASWPANNAEVKQDDKLRRVARRRPEFTAEILKLKEEAKERAGTNFNIPCLSSPTSPLSPALPLEDCLNLQRQLARMEVPKYIREDVRLRRPRAPRKQHTTGTGQVQGNHIPHSWSDNVRAITPSPPASPRRRVTDFVTRDGLPLRERLDPPLPRRPRNVASEASLRYSSLGAVNEKRESVHRTPRAPPLLVHRASESHLQSGNTTALPPSRFVAKGSLAHSPFMLFGPRLKTKEEAELEQKRRKFQDIFGAPSVPTTHASAYTKQDQPGGLSQGTDSATAERAILPTPLTPRRQIPSHSTSHQSPNSGEKHSNPPPGAMSPRRIPNMRRVTSSRAVDIGSDGPDRFSDHEIWEFGDSPAAKVLSKWSAERIMEAEGGAARSTRWKGTHDEELGQGEGAGYGFMGETSAALDEVYKMSMSSKQSDRRF
ncbi:hypothetical protein IAT38_006695 [Cryptococcus sp. DSM 104549]